MVEIAVREVAQAQAPQKKKKKKRTTRASLGYEAVSMSGYESAQNRRHELTVDKCKEYVEK